MVKINEMPVEVNKKQVEMVQEIKNEIPSYEEFMKTYESDERVEDSYRSEYEAQVVQGPQYGPGKKNFSTICSNMKSKQGRTTLSCKISAYSDEYKEGKSYACAIIYAVNNKFNWDVKSGSAKGHRGSGFYVIIKDSSHLKKGVKGKGIVHHSLVLSVIGINPTQHHVSGGGFSFHQGKLKFNSAVLNKEKADTFITDGKKWLSEPEKKLAELCWETYKQHGKNYVFDIDDSSLF